MKRSDRPGHEWTKRAEIVALRIAARLLIADGRLVPADDLLRLGHGGRPMRRTTLSHYLTALRRAGLAIGWQRKPEGYRLEDVLPDAILPYLLPMVHRLRLEMGA